MNKKIKFTIISYIFLSLFFIVVVNSKGIDYSLEKQLNNINLEEIDNLMIVVHPDDETLWGGAHLLKDKYLVVCITCGSNLERVKEFKKVMNLTHDDFVMLNYPDKIGGKRSKWINYKKNIKLDLKNIINLKDWNIIVTHNPDGEYGHIQHKLTSEIVTSLVPLDELTYFERYYSKKNYNRLTTPLPKIDNITYRVKVEKLIKVYKSQKFIKNAFDQMFAHESWVKATDWYNKTEITNI